MDHKNNDVEKMFLKVVEKHTNINDFENKGLLDDENEIKSIIYEILVELKTKIIIVNAIIIFR